MLLLIRTYLTLNHRTPFEFVVLLKLQEKKKQITGPSCPSQLAYHTHQIKSFSLPIHLADMQHLLAISSVFYGRTPPNSALKSELRHRIHRCLPCITFPSSEWLTRWVIENKAHAHVNINWPYCAGPKGKVAWNGGLAMGGTGDKTEWQNATTNNTQCSIIVDCHWHCFGRLVLLYDCCWWRVAL